MMTYLYQTHFLTLTLPEGFTQFFHVEHKYAYDMMVVAALIDRHNLIVLSFPVGVLHRANIRMLGNSEWYFHVKL